ncbi:hypothetical protein VP01_4194g2, partial [Puccinia sorghi]
MFNDYFHTHHPLAAISDKLKTQLHFTKKTACTVHPEKCSEQRASYINIIGPYPLKFMAFIGIFSHSLYSQVSLLITFSLFLPDEFVLEKALSNAPWISILPAVWLGGLITVMAQPGSILRIDMEYFLDVL